MFTPAGRGYRPIADYALLGNAQSAALVAGDGGIDWLCLPDFASGAVLWRLLDAGSGGFLATHPASAVIGMRRRYRDDSLVLETTLTTGDGDLRITDAMPVAEGDPTPALDGVWGGRARRRLVRWLEAVDHPLDLTFEARLGFDFGAATFRIEPRSGGGALVDDGERWLAVVWPGPLRLDEYGTLRGALTVRPGRPVACAVAYEGSEVAARALFDLSLDHWRGQIEATDFAWREWAKNCRIGGPYRATMRRSALTLKALTYEPTGALVAAPTTSLPETIGGVRNWDYRYCWLRDATFTLYALLLVGDRTAARAFWRWIERTCAGDAGAPERLQIMYGIHGGRELPERELDHLDGYRGSRPVRVGNGAWDQRQLDVYGELLDAFWFYVRVGGEDGQAIVGDPGVWGLMVGVADHIGAVWRRKDQGLWEMRGEPQHHVYSKVMCWVGLNRAVRLAERFEPDRDTSYWSNERDAIREEVLRRGYSPRAGAFTMHYETDELDAAALRMPLVGFLPADDPRMRSTIERIQETLSADGLILRYRDQDAVDGLPPGEGAFAICTFWLVDCLTALGRLDEAKGLFERMLGYASDLGLFAEEIDPATGAALGNYPQAFTHLALIDAGVDLTAALERRRAVAGATDERAGQVRLVAGRLDDPPA